MNHLSSPSTYLPGPYSIQLDRDGCDDLWTIVQRSSNTPIAELRFWDSEEHDAAQAEAQARLLGSAPELVDALRQLLAAVQALPAGGLSTELYAAELEAARVLAQVEPPLEPAG